MTFRPQATSPCSLHKRSEGEGLSFYIRRLRTMMVTTPGGSYILMKVLITGATGLLGSHLIKELQQRGEDIRALVLPVENADKLLEQGVEVVRGDITDASTLKPAVQDVEIIFHLAGMMGVWRPLSDYRLVNVKGSENIYKADR